MFRSSRWVGVCLTTLAVCMLAQLPLASGGGKGTVQFKVILPEESAKLWVNGKESKQRGTTRKFDVPVVDDKSEYVLEFKTLWEPNNYTKITRTKVVTFKPGTDVTVDMRKPDEKRKDDIVVRFVATPQKVVDEMLRMAKVGKNDIVWDIGCGDGRFVTTAVKEFGAKSGKGFDIDPVRIKESKEVAERAGVSDKVEFSVADALKMKTAEEATVVTLYMGQDLNLAMRPMLRKTLRPGSRVVSHRFTMGDWKPNESKTIEVEGEMYDIHLWIITEKDNKEGD